MKYSHSSIPVLTIGIPTFNRRDAVLERLQELLSFDLDRKIEILIIDNHSSDGTISALEPREGAPVGPDLNEGSVSVSRFLNVFLKLNSNRLQV